MKYKVNHVKKDFARACCLTGDQERRLKGAIQKAYDQNWTSKGPNIDEINAFVAPYIKTPEEAFYAAQVILTDIWGAMNEAQIKSNFNVN